MIALDSEPGRVRVATHRDEGELLELCRMNHSENGIGEFAPEKALRMMRRAFDPGRNDPGIIGVVGASCIEGSIGLIVDQPWDGETPFLQALWCYVLPQYRASSNQKDLLSWARQLSEPAPVGIGLPLWMGAVVSRRTERQIRAYKRQLGEPCLVTWLCEADDTRAN